MRTVSIADLHITVKEIERRATKHGIKVYYKEDVPTPYATKDSIVLPVLYDPIDEAALAYHRYKVVHELGHHERDEAFDLMERVGDMAPTFQFCWNLVEDEALERETAHRYYGDRVTIENGRSHHVILMNEEFTRSRAAAAPGASINSDTLKQVALYHCALASRRGWHRNVKTLEEHVLSTVPEAETIARELQDEGWHERIAQPLTVPEAYELARELHARLWPENPQPPEYGDVPENKPQQSEEGEGEPQQNSDDQGEGNQGDKDENEQEVQQKNGEVTIPWESLLNSDHKMMTTANPDRNSDRNISYVGWRATSGAFYPCGDVAVVEHPRCGSGYGYSTADIASVANQLRRHIQATTRSTWETERPTGRINKRALKRVVMGTRDYHRRVFQRRTDAKAVDTAITVLVDCSGSMSGKRIEHAAIAAASLSEVFGRILKCKVEVLGHTTDILTGYGLGVVVAKSFSSPATGEEIYRKLCGVPMAGNADGDAMMVAAERLSKRAEQRRILILLADGQPTEACEGDPALVLHMAIDAIKSMGIDTAGIGIQHTGIRNFFKDAEVIDDPTQIGTAILKTAERFVLKN